VTAAVLLLRGAATPASVSSIPLSQFALPIFPSLRLSPLLVSVFPVNFLLLFFLPSLPLFSSQPSPLLLRGSQRRSGVL